jgi:hypothetical protein
MLAPVIGGAELTHAEELLVRALSTDLAVHIAAGPSIQVALLVAHFFQ